MNRQLGTPKKTLTCTEKDIDELDRPVVIVRD